jgi:hypothetical protein
MFKVSADRNKVSFTRWISRNILLSAGRYPEVSADRNKVSFSRWIYWVNE